MNRRGFFKFLGIGAATAAIAPASFTEPVKRWDYVKILPDNVKFSAIALRNHELMEERMQRFLMLKDTQALRKLKRG